MKKINAKTKVKNEDKLKIKKDILGIAENNSDNQQAYMAFKYFDRNFECFSEWSTEELKSFSELIEKINNLTWKQIKRHVGLAYKSIDSSKGIPNNNIKSKISQDISFCELRVTQKARIVGFRIQSVFFVCWLDRNHRICK